MSVRASAMIYPPDELLDDLQSALPPEQAAKSPLPHVMEAAEAIRRSPQSPALNGHTSPSYARLSGEVREDERLFYDRIQDGATERYEMPPDEDPRASTTSQVRIETTNSSCVRV